jgi:hypothetical protein
VRIRSCVYFKDPPPLFMDPPAKSKPTGCMSCPLPKKVNKKTLPIFFSRPLIRGGYTMFLSDGSSKTHKKTFCKKHRVEQF